MGFPYKKSCYRVKCRVAANAVQLRPVSARYRSRSSRAGSLLQAGFVDDLQAHLLQQLVHVNELRKAFVLGLAMVEAVVDLLHDAGQAEQAVGVVEVEIVD